jgi:unsaturated rhamnogalacturonyl hydrolase
MYDRTGDQTYIDAAHRQYEYLQETERTSDGGIRQQRNEYSLCVDGLWMFAPFLARYGQITDTPEAIDDAVQQFQIQSKHLQSDKGLFRHTWVEQPNYFNHSHFWTGGNGFGMMAMVDTYEYLPEGHEGNEVLEDIFEDVGSAMLEYQDRSGFWHNVVDDPQEPLETSGTLMTAYSFKRALDLGMISGDGYREAARKAMDVSKGVVDDEGRVRRVAKVPGGPKAPLGVQLHSQGLFLFTANEFL